VQLLLYGVFVGAPLSCALVILLLEGRRSYKVIRIGQNPLPGEKVLRKTKYRYGVAARVQPAALFAIMALLVGVSIWGSFQAQKLSRNITPCNDNQMSAI
jgi:Flp pilus assembly protein protease CpaA